MSKYNLLLFFLIAPFVIEAKPKVSTLPPWFAEAMSDTTTYIGVAPPCDNPDSAEDMAIAMAVLNWTLNNGNYKARVVGEVSDSQLKNQTNIFLYWAIERESPIEVYLYEVFTNNNNECFIACKISEDNSEFSTKKQPSVAFSKYISISESSDSLYEISDFNMTLKVSKLTGLSRRVPIRTIKGFFSRSLKPSSESIKFECNGQSFQVEKKLIYPKSNIQTPSKADLSIESNMGTSLYRLITTFPPILYSIKARTEISEYDKEDKGKTATEFLQIFENTGKIRPFDLRVIGYSDNNLFYSLSQKEMLSNFTLQYNRSNTQEKSKLAYSAYGPYKNYGFDTGIAKAFVEAASIWIQNHRSTLKGRVLSDSKDIESLDEVKRSTLDGIKSAYESLSESENFNVLWHIGDGSTILPNDIISSDFNYSCGASALELDYREERLARLETLMRQEESKKGPVKNNSNKSSSKSVLTTKQTTKSAEPRNDDNNNINRESFKNHANNAIKDNETQNITQTKTKAHGIVVDTAGEVLIGVKVFNKRAKIGTVTDLDGRFSLPAAKGDSIEYSYVGCNSKIQPAVTYESVIILTPIRNKNDVAEAIMSSDLPITKDNVKFKFRTPDRIKFSDTNFKLTFTTNSKRATYYISGSSESHTVSESDLRTGVLNVELPTRDCDLTLADESGQIHVIHFVYDETLNLRKSATLHILSIGVNDYPAQNLDNLKYAEDDARAITDAIASRHKYTFSNINKTLLVGNEVTPQRISEEIEKIADNAKFDDLAIIFFAGHGLVDSRNYYLATSKVTDSKVPRKGGFSASSFAEKIGYIGCKLVVFIDACHSAKILESFRNGAVNNGEFFKEITSTPNGTNIYTSSGIDVRSREEESFGHGVFSQALIEACDFENSDTNGDGRITIKEIRNYLERRIAQITNNEQFPVYRNLEEISDYPLFTR